VFANIFFVHTISLYLVQTDMYMCYHVTGKSLTFTRSSLKGKSLIYYVFYV